MNFIKTLLLFQSIMLLSAHCSTAKISTNIISSMDEVSGLHFSLNKHKPDRPLLLFVHGTPGDREAYKEYLEDEELNTKYNMVSVDRLGFGNSFNRTAVTTFKEHSKAILTMLNTVFPDQKVSCIGHSYGSPLCLYMMSWQPDLFNDAVLVAGAYNHERNLIRWYNDFGRNMFIKKILPIGLRNSNDEMFALKNELIKLHKLLPKVQSKIHLIHGKKDRIVPVNDSKWLHDKLSSRQKGQYIIEEKDGHFILWKNMKKVKEIILKEVN